MFSILIIESSKQFGGIRNVRMLYTAGHITELCILCKGQLLGRGPVQHSLNIYITVPLMSVSDSLSLAKLANTCVLLVKAEFSLLPHVARGQHWEISVDWSPGSGADSSQIVARRLSGVRCGLMASSGIGNIGIIVFWCQNFTWAWCHQPTPIISDNMVGGAWRRPRMKVYDYNQEFGGNYYQASPKNVSKEPVRWTSHLNIMFALS